MHGDARAAGSRILVVDDEPYIADMLAMSLRYVGYDVATAGTGDAAVRTTARFRPDLVVLDVMLPDSDGFELLHTLRGEQPAAGAVPDRTRRGRGQGEGSDTGGGRLRDQTVQPGGGRRPGRHDPAPVAVRVAQRPTNRGCSATPIS